MKIIFDHQLFSWQRLGGASKYFCMLLKHLPLEEWTTTCIFSNNEYVESLNLFAHRNFFKNYYFAGQGRIMHELNKPHTLRALKKRDYDVYHQTHFDPFGLKAIGNKPMVTTFHDINFSTLNPDPKIVSWQRKSLNRADRIIAVSQNTKKDLIELFNIPDEKVQVVYHGIQLPLVSSVKSLYDFPYLLYVGSRGTHKNFKRLAEAFSMLSKNYSDLRLVCTWKSFTSQELEFLKQLGIENKVVHIMATESQMNAIYANAVAFVFPSIYEGFGMPILEAMSNHCPVILSNSSCLPEIAGNAGIYFNPMDPDDIKDKIEYLINSDIVRSECIIKGDTRVKDFSWQKCAEGHRRVYQSLI